ncbi:MAG: hypothetical protein JNL60_18580 [Bacteroidia bacterium]|nr:hypothetical protein [Bacteroidia bacterium]
MKKLILSVAAALCVSVMTAQTPTNPPSTPATPGNIQAPNTVSDQFRIDYPNTTPNWTMDGTNYRGEYLDPATNARRSVIYDKNGKMISREELINRKDYPAGINAYYAEKYPTENYEVWSTTDASGNRSYYTNRNNEKITFDKEGKYKSNSGSSKAKSKK